VTFGADVAGAWQAQSGRPRAWSRLGAAIMAQLWQLLRLWAPEAGPIYKYDVHDFSNGFDKNPGHDARFHTAMAQHG
jgi:hypothetical protein